MYKLLITSFLIVTSLAKLLGSEFHEFSANCMGTEFKILIDHDKRDICKKAANAAFAELIVSIKYLVIITRTAKSQSCQSLRMREKP